MLKKMSLFNLTFASRIGEQELLESISAKHLVKPSPSTAMTHGWDMVPENEKHVLVVDRIAYLMFGIYERLLPPAVINNEAAERAETFEVQRGYKPGRKQMREIKDEVVLDFLPRAFIQKKNIPVILDLNTGWLAIGTTTDSAADRVLSKLREALGDSIESVSVWSEKIGLPISAQLTQWLATKRAPLPFSIGSNLIMKGTDAMGSAIRYTNKPPVDDAVQKFITAGYRANALQIVWDEKMAFTITETGSFKSVQQLEFLEAQESDESEHEFAASLLLFWRGVLESMAALKAAFGMSVAAKNHALPLENA